MILAYIDDTFYRLLNLVRCMSLVKSADNYNVSLYNKTRYKTDKTVTDDWNTRRKSQGYHKSTLCTT